MKAESDDLFAQSMPKPRILVIGSSNTDMVIRLDHIPRPGETLLGGEFLTAPGGKGANQAVAAARAGGEVTFVARVGQDMFGDQAVARFVDEGIQVDYVFRDQTVPSGVALILLAKDGENSIAVAGGANGRLSPADIQRAAPAIAGASVVLMQLETPLETVQAAAELAARAGVPVMLNPAPAQVLPEELLKLISILTLNEIECELLTGIAVADEPSAARAAAKLLAQGVETVILTLGVRGAYVATASLRELVPAFRVQAVDTTGAGDVFHGVLAVALSEGQPLVQAVRYANAAAAFSVTRFGAQPSAPTPKEIDSVLAQGRAETPGTAPATGSLLAAAPVPSTLQEISRRAAKSFSKPAHHQSH